MNRPFSEREGLRPGGPLIYDNAPESVRYGIREVLTVLGYQRPSEQRRVLCQALRIIPDLGNWTDYPNVDNEVIDLLTTTSWYKLFDALERIPRYLQPHDLAIYFDEVNALLADEMVGYRFESGRLVRVGTEEFHTAVAAAQTALQDERFAEPRRQFHRAYEFRNSFPPDWANAIKEAVNSVEGVLQVLYDRPGVALPTIVNDNLPSDLPGGIGRLFRSLYSQGSGTVGARHASIGGNDPTGPRAELAIHLAAALHAFVVAELN